MKKPALVLATVSAIGLSAMAAPRPAEAHWRGGFGPEPAGGLIAGAVMGDIASSAYAYGPGYGYADYVPYDPTYYGGRVGPCLRRCALYTTTYTTDYAPAYYYRYRHVVRPAYAYSGSFPHFYRHHRWHRSW